MNSLGRVRGIEIAKLTGKGHHICAAFDGAKTRRFNSRAVPREPTLTTLRTSVAPSSLLVAVKSSSLAGDFASLATRQGK